MTIDKAGKIRIYAELETKTIMLKFRQEPTDAEIEIEVTKYIEGKAAEEITRIESQIDDLEGQILLLEEIVSGGYE